MFLFGTGVKKDPKSAFVLLHAAAKAGNVFAQTNLAAMYADGTGPDQNETTAKMWLEKASEKGFDQAMFNLGAMYQSGKGKIEKNLVKAWKWFYLAKILRPPDDGQIVAMSDGALGACELGMTIDEIQKARSAAAEFVKKYLLIYPGEGRKVKHARHARRPRPALYP